MNWIVTILVAWLFADLITGAFHWFEDRYLVEGQSLDFANGIATDNALHHSKPTAMLINSHWENMRSAALAAWPVAALLVWLGYPVWLWLAIAFTSVGNLVHRFAHEPLRNRPRWIRGMQEFGLFVSPEHNDTHHRSEGDLVAKQCATVAYCPMTDWVNPVVDRVQFWGWLEWVLGWLGMRPIGRGDCA